MNTRHRLNILGKELKRLKSIVINPIPPSPYSYARALIFGLHDQVIGIPAPSPQTI